MNRKRVLSFLTPVFILLIITFIASFNLTADKGRIYYSKEDVKVSEDGQKAIILHNLEEEVLILGTDLRADKKIGVIMFIPFPSEPKVSLAPDDAFERAAALVKKYELKYLNASRGITKGGPEAAAEGVELRFNQKLGAHDLTVIKVNDVSMFRQWVNKFFRSKKLPLQETYPKEEAIVDDYVKRGIIYFVLDFVEVLPETRFIEPVIYKFKSRELYYPLKTSNTFGGTGTIELIIMAPTTLFAPDPPPDNQFYYLGRPSRDSSQKIVDTPYTKSSLGLDFPVRASTSALIAKGEEDLKEIYPEGGSFFKDQKAFIQVIKYGGEYHFNHDIFIDAAKGLPSAIGEHDRPRTNGPKCSLKPDRGKCQGNFKRYYYDSLSNECREFIWGGCGRVAPFEKKEECEECKKYLNLLETDLHRAALGGDSHNATLLIASGAEVNARDRNGHTPLHWAALDDHNMEVIELLIANGADANARSDMGYTPLDRAFDFRCREVAGLLIAKGADINARNKNGETKLDLATSKEEFELLISLGADINAKDKNGRAPLYKAIMNDQKEVADLLISKGADVNTSNEFGQTLLHFAAREEDKIEVVRLLIAKGADINARNDDGDTPLTLAKEHYKLFRTQAQKEIIDLLKKHGAK